MPIARDMVQRYPADWAHRRRLIFGYRARNRCEWCGAENDQPHPDTGSVVLLTLAHVWDMAPESASLLNLACLCQRCHNWWDAADRPMRRIRKRLSRMLQAGQLPLPWPASVSMAVELYQLLIDAGQLTPPQIQLPIPREAYEYAA